MKKLLLIPLFCLALLSWGYVVMARKKYERKR